MHSLSRLVRKYISYYIHASNAKGHGVHSPFVFNFIKSVLNDRTRYSVYDSIEKVRDQLLADSRMIDVEDFGAGSSVMKSSSRAVKNIAGSSLKSKKFAQLLYRMVAHFKPSVIVELGTSLGITTSYLASGNTTAQVYTLEGSQEISEIAVNTFSHLKIGNIILKTGAFEQTLPEVLSEISQVDFAFVDGNHRRAPTLAYLDSLLTVCNEYSVIVFDDIHWSSEMEEAWVEIISNDAVTLSIDLFFVGVVFFRKDFKAKQHFSIRF